MLKNLFVVLKNEIIVKQLYQRIIQYNFYEFKENDSLMSSKLVLSPVKFDN